MPYPQNQAGFAGVNTPQQNQQPQQQQPGPGQSSQMPLNNQGQPQGQPQQGYPQNYGFNQPQQPQQQSQQQNVPRLSLSGNEILDGASVPPELRGRKVSDVMRIYSTLADDFITRNRQQGQGQNSQQQQQPQQQQQNSQRQGQQNSQSQGQQQAQNPDFWQNPDESLTNIVRQVVEEAVSPFQQQSMAQASRQALQQARQTIPDFQDLEPDIMEAVKGSSPEALANPEYWQHAADLARGRRMRNAQNPHSQQQPQQPEQNALTGQPARAENSIFGPSAVPATTPIPQPVQPQPQNPIGMPMNGAPQMFQQGQQQQQRPQTHQFFTEAPTAPSVYNQTHQGALTPQQREVARLAGIPEGQYHAWSQIQNRGR